MARVSSQKNHLLIYTIVVFLTMLCTTDIGNATNVSDTNVNKSNLEDVREYFLTVGNEQVHFVSQSEAGNVLKLQDEIRSVDALSRFLNTKAVDEIHPIRSSGRKGIYIIKNGRLPNENDRTIKALGLHNEVQYAAPLFSSNDEIVAIIPEVVVRVIPGTEIEQVHILCETVGCKIIKRMMFTEQEYLLEVLGPNAESVFETIEQLNTVDWIEWASPNTVHLSTEPDPDVSAMLYSAKDGYLYAEQPTSITQGVIPNDEYWAEQWHLHNTGQYGGTPDADINATEAWEITTGDPNIVVAVLDDGVDVNHPDLINNLVPGYDFYEGDDDPYPPYPNLDDAHGTMCAGLIAAQGNNSIGVVGVTWNCKIMPIRTNVWVLYGKPESEIATAIRWAATQGADILSNSWGDNTPLPIIHSAFVDVTSSGGIGRRGKGCVVIAASGNAIGDKGKPIKYPARYPEVISVGATDCNDSRWEKSNYGPELDIMAPSAGVNVSPIPGIWSTDITGSGGYNDSDYIGWCMGTSTSTAIVSGAAALILSIEPELTNEEVRHFLTRSAKDLGRPGRDNYYGWGRVDARAALDMVLAKRVDLNDNWKVDIEDLLILIEFWRTNEPSADIAPATKRDGIVNEEDLDLLIQYWQTEIPLPGLVAHWKLDETEGTVAYDSAGEKDIFLSAEQLWRPDEGKIGGALELDGIDDYAGTSPVLNPADGPFSVLAWIKGGGSGQVMISQTDGFSGGTGGTWLGIDISDGKLMTGLVPSQDLSLTLDSQVIITDGQWHHVGFVCDGSYRALYVDGFEVAKDATAVSPLQSSDGSIYIGVDKNVDPSSFFSGMLDDIRIYNRALTLKQIETLAK